MGLPRFASAVGAAEGGLPLGVRAGRLLCTVIVHGFCHPGVADRQSFTDLVSRTLQPAVAVTSYHRQKLPAVPVCDPDGRAR